MAASDILLGLGSVAVVEGLVVALAPGRLRSLIETLDRLGTDQRRVLGLVVVGVGVLLVWLALG